MKTYKKILALLMAVAAVGMMAACGSTAEEPAEAETEDAEVVEATTEEAAAPADAAGFTEYPIFEDEEIAFMNVSAVYFQPVPMAPDQEDIEGFDLHLECDVSAMENSLGYELGSWVPYMTIDFEVINEATGETAAEGSFMVMAASDGPHYGATIALPEAGTYSLTITIHSPADNNYLLHTDELTGPGAKSFDEAFPDGVIPYTYDSWDYLGPQSAE